MRFVLNGSAGAVGTYTTEALLIDGYENTDGLGDGIMVLSFSGPQLNGAVVSSARVEHSIDDGDSWTTLLDLNALLDGQSPVLLYQFGMQLRLVYTLATIGPHAYDPGIRFSVSGHVYAFGDWNKAVVCREEHLRQVWPYLADMTRGFPASWDDAAKVAKIDQEAAIRARDLDPNRLLLDGHNSVPCVEGMELSGAWRVMYYLVLKSRSPNREEWQKDLEMAQHEWELATERFMTSGRAVYDSNRDYKPNVEDEPPEDMRRQPVLVI